MEELKKTELFERTPIPRAIATLAVPTILSSLVMVIYNLADTYFVGMINDPIQSAAVTLAAPVLLAFNAVNNLFGIGSSSMMSRALGIKNYDVVRKSSAFGFYGALFCGVLFSLIVGVFNAPLLNLLGASADTSAATGEYLKWTVCFGAAPAILNVVLAFLVRSEGSSLHASVGTMSGCLLNILLDPIFILPQGFNMGAAGAGFATFISNCVACIYFFVLLFIKRKNTYVSISPRDFRPTRAIVGGVCGVGIPAAIQNLLNVTGMTVLNNFTSVYGSDPVAAMGIAQKINMVPMQVALGFSQGIMPLVSYNYSGKNYRRMKKTIIFSSCISIGFLIIVTGVYFLSAGFLTSLFMQNESIVAYGESFLRGLCIAMPFLGMDFIAVGVFQSCGMGRKSLVFALLRKIILEIPALCILNFIFPLYGLAYAQFTAEIVLSAAAVISFIGLFKGLESADNKLI